MFFSSCLFTGLKVLQVNGLQEGYRGLLSRVVHTTRRPGGQYYPIDSSDHAGPHLLQRSGGTGGLPVLVCEADGGQVQGGAGIGWELDSTELAEILCHCSFSPDQFLLQSPSPLASRCSSCLASRRAAGGCLLWWSKNLQKANSTL